MWSGASNRKERNIFKDEIINNQLNSNFFPIRLEASSEEGLLIQKQFGIAALPAYLIINRQGEIVRLRIGESSMKSFSTFLVESLNEPKGYENLEKETLISFNASTKVPNDYSWVTYNFNYITILKEFIPKEFTNITNLFFWKKWDVQMKQKPLPKKF